MEADFDTFQQSEPAEFTWWCFRNRVLKQFRIQPKDNAINAALNCAHQSATLPRGDAAAVTPHSKIYRQLGKRVYDSIAPLS